MKKIPDFAPYEAAEDGNIYRNGRRLAQRSNGKGYMAVTLSCGGKVTTQYAHRLVCAAWHGRAPDGKHVRHINGKRSDNRPENLAWATKLENEADKELHGTRARGEKIGNAKLTAAIVLAARTRAANKEPIAEIAAALSVNPGTLADAICGKKWKHLPGAVAAFTTRRRLTDEQVREIRASSATEVQLAKRYGVVRQAIGQIRRRESYAHL